MTGRPGRNTQVAADREAIRRSGSLQFLLDIVAGKPAPIRDAAGRVVDWSPPPELPLRVSTATALVKKVLPDLQAQAIDLQTSGDGMIRIYLGDVPPPASVDDTAAGEGLVRAPERLADGRDAEEALRMPAPVDRAPEPAESAWPAEEPEHPVRRRTQRSE